jgi:lipopolysaccharide export system protein LptA
MSRSAAALLALSMMVATLATARVEAQTKAPPKSPPAAATSAAATSNTTAATAPTNSASNALGLAGDDNNKPLNIEADNGIEWQQNNHVYIARGNAKATRGDNTVTADTLYAYYRNITPPPNGGSTTAPPNGGPATTPPKSGPATTPANATTAAASSGTAKAPDQSSPLDNGSTQVYRIEAEGNVVFTTPTQSAYGDHAVYDVDQAVLVVTGKNLKIVTPQDVVTARDSLEWYDQKQIGVARGNAVAVRQGPQQKSIAGDILTSEITKPANGPSKISKVDAQGHVIVVSQDQIARGDSGVYNLDTGIATLSDHVTLTRGENELRGQYAVVDTNTNVARLLSAPPSAQMTGTHPRVSGLLIPHQQDQQLAPGSAAPPGSNKPAASQPGATSPASGSSTSQTLAH